MILNYPIKKINNNNKLYFTIDIIIFIIIVLKYSDLYNLIINILFFFILKIFTNK